MLLYSNDSKKETNVLPVPHGTLKMFLLLYWISFFQMHEFNKSFFFIFHSNYFKVKVIDNNNSNGESSDVPLTKNGLPDMWFKVNYQNKQQQGSFILNSIFSNDFDLIKSFCK